MSTEEAAASVNIVDNEPNLKKESFLSKYWPQTCWGYAWISRRIPIFKWIFQYSHRDVLYDIIAGLTVASIAIPQSIAHASVAGLEPQRGLYSEIFPGLVYLFMGSTSYTIICKYYECFQLNILSPNLLRFPTPHSHHIHNGPAIPAGGQAGICL